MDSECLTAAQASKIISVRNGKRGERGKDGNIE